jgi:hypothetical protein
MWPTNFRLYRLLRNFLRFAREGLVLLSHNSICFFN